MDFDDVSFLDVFHQLPINQGTEIIFFDDGLVIRDGFAGSYDYRRS